jgi:hypothetical protein
VSQDLQRKTSVGDKKSDRHGLTGSMKNHVKEESGEEDGFRLMWF